jgi:hypothetical protein
VCSSRSRRQPRGIAITNRDEARFDALIAEYRLQRAIGML